MGMVIELMRRGDSDTGLSVGFKRCKAKSE